MQGDRHFPCSLSYSYPHMFFRRMNCDKQTVETTAWRKTNLTITSLKRLFMFGRIDFKIFCQLGAGLLEFEMFKNSSIFFR